MTELLVVIRPPSLRFSFPRAAWERSIGALRRVGARSCFLRGFPRSSLGTQMKP